MYDCAVDWVSLDPELLLESKMDATWYTPQSLHNSSCCELFSVFSKAGADAIVVVGEDMIGVDEVDPIAVVDDDTIGVDEVDPITVVDDGTIGVDEVDPIAVVDDGTIGVDEVDPIAVVDDVSTPDRPTGARVEGRKIPYLLT